MSPSKDVKFSNVRGLYLRKYGTYIHTTKGIHVRPDIHHIISLLHKFGYHDFFLSKPKIVLGKDPVPFFEFDSILGFILYFTDTNLD